MRAVRTLAAYVVLARLYAPVTAILATWAVLWSGAGVGVGWLVWGR